MTHSLLFGLNYSTFLFSDLDQDSSTSRGTRIKFLGLFIIWFSNICVYRAGYYIQGWDQGNRQCAHLLRDLRKLGIGYNTRVHDLFLDQRSSAAAQA